MATDAPITAPSENDAPTPLYRLFDEYPQVVQTHILTKLNRNERKFLYDVNRRMRALMRDGGIELSPWFRVSELESVSTLSFVWDAYNIRFWHVNQREFFMKVVMTNKLELVRWLREEKNCKWDYRCIVGPSSLNYIDVLRYLFAEGCPLVSNKYPDEEDNHSVLYANAAASGFLEQIELFREYGLKWNQHVACNAIRYCKFDILKYYMDNGGVITEAATYTAAKSGRLAYLQYLRSKNCPWDWRTCYYANSYGHADCLEFARSNGCPEPLQWDGLLSDAEEEDFFSEEE
jgi:hypothetical protein